MRPVVRSDVQDPDSVEDSCISDCLTYWRGQQGEAFAPRWTDFHLHELPSRTLPYILVLDVVGEPPEYVYRYWGSGHTQYHQRDYTGKKLTDMADAWSADLLTRQYNAVRDARRPVVFLNSYEGVENPLKSLRMPLSEDGAKVTHLVSFVGRQNVSESLKPLFSARA